MTTIEEYEAETRRWEAAVAERETLARRVQSSAPLVTFAPSITPTPALPQLTNMYKSALSNSVPFKPLDLAEEERKRSQEQREIMAGYFAWKGEQRALAGLAQAQPIAPPIPALSSLLLE